MDTNNFCQGYWEVGENKFINKVDALNYSNANNELVHFRYFDNIFENTDITKLGQQSLNFWYKERAQQIRDQYDYLILYFSGGADSYNVLRTFLDNNIHLDEVCVKWCMQTKNSNSLTYKPTTLDDSPTNYLSEFDFAIKPVLDYIQNNYPSIKTTIVDWLPNVESTINEALFLMVNNWHDVELPMMVTYSPSENIQAKLGKKVASIYGIDKPKIYYYDEDAYMYFTDGATTMGVPNPNNPYGIEYFYWTPKMPQLAFEMAYKVIRWELANEAFFYDYGITDKKRKTFWDGTAKIAYPDMYQIRETTFRNVLYTTWDNKFQANKPLILDRTDKHFWITKYKQLSMYQQSFNYMLDNIIVNCNKNYIWVDPTTNKKRYKLLPSKKHLVLKSYKKYLKNEYM